MMMAMPEPERRLPVPSGGRHELIARLVATWSERLRLRAFTFHIQTNVLYLQHDESRVDLAHTRVYPGSQAVSLEVARALIEEPDPQEVRVTVLHELVHCRLNGMKRSGEHLEASRALSNREFDIWWEGFEEQLELATDELARALAAAPGWRQEDEAFCTAWKEAKP